MRSIQKLLLFLFKDPEYLHNFILKTLVLLGKSKLLCRLVARCANVRDPKLEQTVFGIKFKNPVGLAAGVDKNGAAIAGLTSFGFGFLEIGTLSWHPQDGNPRQRLFKLPKDQALINRMGFNSVGAQESAHRLSKQEKIIPVGISIGKSKITPLKDAASDYVSSFKILFPFADYFAINISSPNTPGLRELQDKNLLKELLQALHKAQGEMVSETKLKRKPILVKIAPDLTFEAIKEAVDVCKQENVDGIIATNTTISREHLRTEINEIGGLSGAPLKDRSTEIIRFIHKEAPNLPIIGVGGIFTAADAYEKLKAGASLIQIYTGLVYEGPFLARTINKGLLKLFKRDNISSIGAIVLSTKED